MTPTLRTLRLLAAWMLLGVVASIWSPASIVWKGAGVLLGAVALVDALMSWLQKPITAERRLPGRFALGNSQEVSLRLTNPGKVGINVECYDGIPPTVESPHL